MDVGQFDEYILTPTLKSIGMYSSSARILMLGTALIESELVFIEQIGKGTAKGFYQIEELTYNDILRYLNKPDNTVLKDRCLFTAYYDNWPPFESVLHNIRWATIIARLKYWMQPEALPESDDAEGLANYYKRYFNTHKGKSEMPAAIIVFERVNRVHGE